MGKYKTSVASFASPLVEFDGKTASKNTVGSLCYRADYPINKGLLNNMQKGTASKLKQFYTYGRDTYTYGLPDGYVVNTGVVDTEAVKAAILADTGLEVDIQIAFIASPDTQMFSRAHATKYWGYTYERNYMTDPPIGPAYGGHSNGIAVGHNSTVGEGYLNKDGSFVHDISIDYNSSKDEYTYLNYTTKLEDTLWHPRNDQIYYHIRYIPKGSADTNHGYWFYKLGSNLHPELEKIEKDEDLQFLPIVPLREFNKNLGPKIQNGDYVRDEDGNKITPDTELYKTSKHLLKIIGLDFDTLCLGVAENPDVGDIDHAYVTFAIDIRSKTKEGKKYIYQFFRELALKSPDKGDIEIRDAAYNVHIRYDSSTISTKQGSLNEDTQLTYSGDTLIIKRKVSDNSYEEVVVTNLQHVNYIYEGHAEVTTLEDSADEDNYGFLIPLQYNIVKNERGLFGRQDLLTESLVLVFNCYERTKLKWYQRGWFKIFMIVISIVIIIFSWGTLTAPIVAAYQAGIAALATLAVQYAAYSYGVKMALEYLVKEFGMDVAIVAAIIAVIAIVVAPQVAGTATNSLLSAETLLEVTAGISNATTIVYNSGMLELQSEMNEFNEYANELTDELNALQDELLDATWITPDIINGREHINYPNENPEDFYNRTIHAGNVGTYIYNIIPSYVASKTSLPDLNKIT